MSELGNSSGTSSSSDSPQTGDADTENIADLDLDTGHPSRWRSPGRPILTTKRLLAPYNHQKQQEIARRNIAYALICLVTALVLMSFIYLWTLPLNESARKHVENLMLFMQLIFGPIITLAATAIGYYFGANSRTGRL